MMQNSGRELPLRVSEKEISGMELIISVVLTKEDLLSVNWNLHR